MTSQVYEILYKVSSKDKLLEWHLEREDNQYITISGQVGGKMKISKPTTAKSKNVGKSNETTSEEQAHIECLAKIKKKLDNGEYFKSIEEAKSTKSKTRPMLANVYYSETYCPKTNTVLKVTDNRPKDIDKETYYIQPKLDGSIQGNSKVITQEGLKTIKEIVENKLFINVLSYNEDKRLFEYKPIIGHSGETSSSYKDWKDIYINDLFYLKCTFDHPIYTNNGWKQAKDLDVTRDKLYVSNIDKSKYYFSNEEYINRASDNYEWTDFNIKSSKYCEDNITKYDIEVKDNHNFIANNIVVHNCRCISYKEGLLSRENREITAVNYIKDSLSTIFSQYPDLVLDGELYIHDKKFEEIVSLVRPDKEKAEEGQPVKYYIYDIIEESSTYTDRYKKLQELEKLFDNRLILVKSEKVNSLNEIDRLHDFYVEKGYEGAILRKGNSLYEQKRSDNLLKVKSFQDAEFTILDILEGKGNNKNIASKIKIQIDSDDVNSIVYPNMTGTWDFCKEVFNNKEEYIGGQVTVKFFGYTAEGSLRFPTVKALYKEKRDI